MDYQELGTGAIGILLLIITGLATYKGFSDRDYFEKYLFGVDQILIGKEYVRLISSGFLHANWLHFGFNMIALMSFSDDVEILMGEWKFLLIYFGSLIGGNLFALYIHQNHGDYRAIGASGAISGVIFSFIVFFPNSSISFFLLPIHLPSWLFGLLFIAVSIFGIKSQRDNIGHEAHLGGAIVGVLLTVLLKPAVLFINWWIVIAVLVPVFFFLYVVIYRPEILLIDGYWGFDWKKLFNNRRQTKNDYMSKEEELNFLLDKIRKNGIKSLTKKERDRLKKLREELL